MKNVQKGFTLIELMIVVAIIGILAAVAIPSYQNYTLKAKFTEVVNASSPFKTAVELCAQDGTCVDTSDPANLVLYQLSLGTGGIPNTTATQYVKQVDIATNGILTVTPKAAGGLAEADTYILTPTLRTDSSVTWAISGGCKTRVAGALC